MSIICPRNWYGDNVYQIQKKTTGNFDVDTSNNNSYKKLNTTQQEGRDLECC